jgi:hypothetical protein
MTLNQLVCRAASAYPEAYPLRYWDPYRQEPVENPEGGDSLARFVTRELADTFDPGAGDDEQVAAAVRCMQAAADDLAAVAHALGNLSRERAAA